MLSTHYFQETFTPLIASRSCCWALFSRNLLYLIGKFLVDRVVLVLKLLLEVFLHCLKFMHSLGFWIWPLLYRWDTWPPCFVFRDCLVTSVEVQLCELEEGAEVGKVTSANMAPTPAPRGTRVLQGLHCFCCSMEHWRENKSSRTRSHSQGKGDLDNALPKKGLVGFGADRRREWRGNQLHN